MLLLGIDLGTSSVKVSVVDADSQELLATASYPESDAAILTPQPGWAEQDPRQWWEFVQQAILKCNTSNKYNPKDIGAIGIGYQMHGLVLADKNQNVLRNAIIWCDSRAVEIGEEALQKIGVDKCLTHLLNSPGNFTASKLAWVKQNEPDIYSQIDKFMLPGDYIAMQFTGVITTSTSALSEGIFWDFKRQEVSEDVVEYFQFDKNLFPKTQPLFSEQAIIRPEVATKLSLGLHAVVSYKAGDQPNNALSLNVLNPGEVAANAGTSGVIYGVSDQAGFDPLSRINSFAHVNYTPEQPKIGVLLCINGTGIFNKWTKQLTGAKTYQELNELAQNSAPGAEGLLAIPFGNGAERMLNNKIPGAQFLNIDFNRHGTAEIARAVQEGIAFSFRYGLDIMRENGIDPTVVRAGKSNLFLSNIFASTFAAVNNVAIEYYEGDGSYGAAIGAGIGTGFYSSPEEAGKQRKVSSMLEPSTQYDYEPTYQKWKAALTTALNKL